MVGTRTYVDPLPRGTGFTKCPLEGAGLQPVTEEAVWRKPSVRRKGGTGQSGWQSPEGRDSTTAGTGRAPRGGWGRPFAKYNAPVLNINPRERPSWRASVFA